MFCLGEDMVNVFLKKIKSGEINPEKLAGMKSSERRAFFSSFTNVITSIGAMIHTNRAMSETKIVRVMGASSLRAPSGKNERMTESSKPT